MKILQSLDLAEDRGSFSTLLKENNIPYPDFGVATNAEEAVELSSKLNFPILIRPSYVLGGQGMKIVINKEELVDHVVDLLSKIPNNNLLSLPKKIKIQLYLRTLTMLHLLMALKSINFNQKEEMNQVIL